MVVDWQLDAYLPHYGGPHGTRYGYGKMVCVCVCVCLSASVQRSAQQPNLTKTFADSSKGPCTSRQNSTLAVHQTVW